jgi:hypothetical protein|tara:strand:+ start:331 stop:546 length:216 start_codon:yes stop_codon:yes gene_type:complete
MIQVPVKQLIEFTNLVNECCSVMEHDEVGTWLTTPNSHFNMDKPIDFFWDGGQEKIYRILYFIDIGEADLF